MIAAARMDKAVAYLYEVAARHENGMGLAITLAASAYQIPRARMARELHRRRAELSAATAQREQTRAAGMWWNE